MNPYNQLHRSKSDPSDSYKRKRDDHYEDLVSNSIQRPSFVGTRSHSISETINVKHDLSPPIHKRIYNNSMSSGRSAVYENTFFPNEFGGSFGLLDEVPPVHPALRVKNYADQDPEADHVSRSWPILPSNPNISYATPSRPDYNSGPSGSVPLEYNDPAAALCTPASEGYYSGASYEINPFMLVERRPYSNFYNPQEPSTLQDSMPSISLTNSFKENQVRPPRESPVSLCSTGSAKQTVTPDRGTTLPATSEAAKPEKRFKAFHEEKWNEHLQQLCEFKSKYGHCLVPHTYPDDQHLARWVKRQRRQYKLMLDGTKTSTMSQGRVDILNSEGFIWDSHEVVWQERYRQLIEFRETHGSCRVPSYCKDNPQLASWVKCQRRQYKLFWEGKRSSMSVERTQLLEDVGFTWEVRPDVLLKKKKSDMKKLAEVLNGL